MKNQICSYVDKKLDLLKKNVRSVFVYIKLRFYQEKIRFVLNSRKKNFGLYIYKKILKKIISIIVHKKNKK